MVSLKDPAQNIREKTVIVDKRSIPDNDTGVGIRSRYQIAEFLFPATHVSKDPACKQ